MTLDLKAIRARVHKAKLQGGLLFEIPLLPYGSANLEEDMLALLQDVAAMVDAIEQYRELIQAMEEKGLVVVHKKGWVPFPGTADPSVSLSGGQPRPRLRGDYRAWLYEPEQDDEPIKPAAIRSNRHMGSPDPQIVIYDGDNPPGFPSGSIDPIGGWGGSIFNPEDSDE